MEKILERIETKLDSLTEKVQEGAVDKAVLQTQVDSIRGSIKLLFTFILAVAAGAASWAWEAITK